MGREASRQEEPGVSFPWADCSWYLPARLLTLRSFHVQFSPDSSAKFGLYSVSYWQAICRPACHSTRSASARIGWALGATRRSVSFGNSGKLSKLDFTYLKFLSKLCKKQCLSLCFAGNSPDRKSGCLVCCCKLQSASVSCLSQTIKKQLVLKRLS